MIIIYSLLAVKRGWVEEKSATIISGIDIGFVVENKLERVLGKGVGESKRGGFEENSWPVVFSYRNVTYTRNVQ